MRVLIGLALAAALGSPLRAEVTVRGVAGRVHVTANAAPLADVLDRLARQTGMKVVYEGPAPRQLVTVSLRGRSPAEAVHDLLEGQGLNYALLGDSSGTGVQTLLMTGPAASVASSSSGSASSAPPAFRSRGSAPPPMSSPDTVEGAEGGPEEGPPPEPAAAVPGIPGPTNEGRPPGAGNPPLPGTAVPGAAPATGNPLLPLIQSMSPTGSANPGA